MVWFNLNMMHTNSIKPKGGLKSSNSRIFQCIQSKPYSASYRRVRDTLKVTIIISILLSDSFLSPQIMAQKNRQVCAASATTSNLPPSLASLVSSFQAVPDPMARYKQLLFFATKLETLPDADRIPENKVKGCVSQVWVVPTLKPEDGKIYWKADSDSQLTKGLAALLVQGLSRLTPEEIVKVQPDFIASLGLAQALTPSRNNGFLNMFKLMQAKALELLLQQKQQELDKTNSSNGSGSGSDAQDQTAAAAAQPSTNESTPSSSSPTSSNTPVADKVKEKLQQQLQPAKLNILDDSSKHAGHGGYKGTANYSGETHFTIEVVSAAFEGLSSVKRHRLVYGILDEEMGSPIHALSLVTKTPGEAGM